MSRHVNRPTIRRAGTCVAAALVAAVLGAAPSRAQTLAELAAYAGPDRTARLIAGAKKEGTVSLYSSATLADQSLLIGAFQAKYGIKVQQWRGSSEDIRNRAVTEYAGGRYDVDVAETAGPSMEAMVREQLLQPVTTPAAEPLVPQARYPHKSWTATRLTIFVGAYNTNLVKPADVPKSYEDLRDPKWKGKLGIETEDSEWFLTVCSTMGEQKCSQLFHDIVATNGISVRKGHTLLSNLVGIGEVPLALTSYSYRVEQMKNEGAPVDPNRLLHLDSARNVSRYLAMKSRPSFNCLSTSGSYGVSKYPPGVSTANKVSFSFTRMRTSISLGTIIPVDVPTGLSFNFTACLHSHRYYNPFLLAEITVARKFCWQEDYRYGS